MVYSHEKHKVRLIANDRLFRRPVSSTFHGRDIFAPVAAHLASGVTPARVGKLIEDYLRPSFEQPARSGKRTWNGTVLKIDRFGNIVTNFHVNDFPNLEQHGFILMIGSNEITTMSRNYAERKPGELFAIVGSSGYVEVSVGQGSASRLVGCVTGAAVELTAW
jgi:S-adenosylmethionine hydrolase